MSRSRGLSVGAIALAVALLARVGLWYRDYSHVAAPVASALAQDSRNSGYELRAHYHWFYDSSVLVLDLTEVKSAAPMDLLRGVFSAAEAMHREDRRFEKVILARAGEPIFTIDGRDFASLGSSVAAGENPVYLVRTFPEKLKRPSGAEAFGTWTGGILGVSLRQLEDVNRAAREWMGGEK